MVLSHCMTSCESFAPADLSPFKVVAWLKRLSTGSFDTCGSFPCGSSGTKSVCKHFEIRFLTSDDGCQVSFAPSKKRYHVTAAITFKVTWNDMIYMQTIQSIAELSQQNCKLWLIGTKCQSIICTANGSKKVAIKSPLSPSAAKSTVDDEARTQIFPESIQESVGKLRSPFPA